MPSPSFDSSVGGSATASATLTLAGVVANNANRYLGVSVAYLTFGTTLNTVKWNGTDLTKQFSDEFRAGANMLEYWDLVNPANGSFNLVFTFSAVTTSQGGLWSLYNADLNAPRRTTARTTGNSTAPSATITGVDTDIVLGGVGASSVTNTPDATWTADWTPDIGLDPSNSGRHINGAASITRTDSLSLPNAWGVHLVSIKSIDANNGLPANKIYYTKPYGAGGLRA